MIEVPVTNCGIKCLLDEGVGSLKPPTKDLQDPPLSLSAAGTLGSRVKRCTSRWCLRLRSGEACLAASRAASGVCTRCVWLYLWMGGGGGKSKFQLV